MLLLLLLLLLDTQIPTWALFCSTFIAVYAGHKLAMCLSSLFKLLHCIHFCFRKYAHQPIQMPNQFVIFSSFFFSNQTLNLISHCCLLFFNFFGLFFSFNFTIYLLHSMCVYFFRFSTPFNC